ncbi:MAG: SMI1/KNR4 family protein [Bacteroidetes bacterium]|nr:SMI1/KNR4 family protein [Bacteroidota bacterium]
MDHSMLLPDLLDALADAGVWFPNPPADLEQIEAAQRELGKVFPDELTYLLLRADGGELRGPHAGLSPFNCDLFAVHNQDPAWTDLAPMLIFAADSGSNIYFYDSENELGRGLDAIYLADMGAPFRNEAIFAASSLAGLFKRIADGDDPADSTNR